MTCCHGLDLSCQLLGDLCSVVVLASAYCATHGAQDPQDQAAKGEAAGARFRDVLDLARASVATGIVSFPLDISRYMETAKRGRATAEMVSIAFGELGLHRVQAGTQPENLASQRVLVKNSFRQYGYSPEYLLLAGEWRDEVLFQRLATDRVDGQAADYPRSAITRP
jgi:hypothetical protein